MSKCDDFLGEKSAMVSLLDAIGVEMEQTPKCHPELAGCGIEYTWGYSKMYFRRNNDFCAVKEKFLKRVLHSFSSDVIGVDQVRNYARKANEYKRAYGTLIHSSEAVVPLELIDIEKTRAIHKTHRCAKGSDIKAASIV